MGMHSAFRFHKKQAAKKFRAALWSSETQAMGCIRTYNEAAGFPPSPLGPEHGVAVEVGRAVLRVLVAGGRRRLQPLRRHGWPRAGESPGREGWV